MDTMEKYKDMTYQRSVRTDRAPYQTGSLSHTDWQTPFVSGKSVSRFAEVHGTKRCPGTGSENTEEFYSASGSSSFQPIKSQVTIPTAHVMPSTIQITSNNMPEHAAAQMSTGFLSFPYLSTSDPSTTDDHRRFETPNIEPTLNQSGLLHTLYADPRPSASNGEAHCVTNPYRSLPESRDNASGDAIHKAGDIHLNNQGWRPESYSLNPGAEYHVQQQQQMEHMRLRMEQLQLARGCLPPPVYPNHSGLGSILKSNENVLLEKEFLVERQRQHISQLEQKLRESDVQVHGSLMSQINPYSDVFVLKLQELQREVTFLRSELATKIESSSKEKADMEKKLAAYQAEANDFKGAVVLNSQKHCEELKKLEERVKARDRHINLLKKKCEKEAGQNKEKQQRIETLERYVTDLPTAQDHQKQSQELLDLKENSRLLQDQVKDLESKLRDIRASCREKTCQLATEECKRQELLNTIRSLQQEVDRSKGDGLREEEKRLTQEGETLRQEVRSLHKERECLKKVLESQKKKMEQLCGRVKELEEQVSQEEGTGQALKEESQRKENALQQLKEAVKELAVQNQDLMERNVFLQEQLHQTGVGEQLSSLTESTLLMSLNRELHVCLKDMKSICCLLSQRVQGMDPNLSMLLGIHSTPISENDELLDSTSLEKHLKGVRQLKRDIDDLRTSISDHYAQDMGDNCITQ
ncbi:centrosomal protein of 85 kDa [Pelodytes ibericus]